MPLAHRARVLAARDGQSSLNAISAPQLSLSLRLAAALIRSGRQHSRSNIAATTRRRVSRLLRAVSPRRASESRRALALYRASSSLLPRALSATALYSALLPRARPPHGFGARALPRGAPRRRRDRWHDPTDRADRRGPRVVTKHQGAFKMHLSPLAVLLTTCRNFEARPPSDWRP